MRRLKCIDWIQDSLHEQSARRKGPSAPTGLRARLDALDGVPGFLWSALSQVLDEGESWVVITLVGELQSLPLKGKDRQLTFRCRHWRQFGAHVDHHGLAFRHEDGILHDRMVAVAKVLLPRDLRGRRGLRGMEELGWCRAVQIYGVYPRRSE